jgi:formyl-CoA transferase
MSKALDGIRVIDFTHDQAGPACTQMLAWLGADVIKIERPPHGDRARRLWFNDRADLDSYFFLLLNANKRSAVVDLKTSEGKEIARRLVREAAGELLEHLVGVLPVERGRDDKSPSASLAPSTAGFPSL